jgi:hypothetical protein
MNERIQKLMLASGYAAPELAARAQLLVDLVIKECLIAIENTSTNHAYTSYDLDVIKHTIRRSREAVALHFGEHNDQV